MDGLNTVCNWGVGGTEESDEMESMRSELLLFYLLIKKPQTSLIMFEMQLNQEIS